MIFRRKCFKCNKKEGILLNFDKSSGIGGGFHEYLHKATTWKKSNFIFGFVFQYTVNGKKVEVAVKQIIAGKEVEQRGAFSNPEALDLYQNIPELQDY